jgi:hypothetical protein
VYFHYCRVDTFKNIMNSKVLWLSNLTESNDTQEVTRTFDILWSAVKRRLLESDIDRDVVEKEIEILDHQYQIEVQIDKPYGVCFCKKADVLQQWLEYGDKTRGVVLGFDFNWFNGLKKEMPHPSSKFLNAIGYDEVLYHNKQLEEEFYKICYDAIKEHGLNAWIMGIRPTFKHYSAFIKNPTFDGEYETRIVYYPNSSEEFVDNALRISELVDAPFAHYCLPWTNGDGNNALKAIGLGCNCELTKEDVNSILINAGLSGEFQLFRSECSYRLR